MSQASPKECATPAEAMGFHTTHWTAILAAQKDDGATAEQALASLCSIYWYPLYAFARQQGRNPQEAEDLTQEFFARLLAKNGLASVRGIL